MLLLGLPWRIVWWLLLALNEWRARWWLKITSRRLCAHVWLAQRRRARRWLKTSWLLCAHRARLLLNVRRLLGRVWPLRQQLLRLLRWRWLLRWRRLLRWRHNRRSGRQRACWGRRNRSNATPPRRHRVVGGHGFLLSILHEHECRQNHHPKRRGEEKDRDYLWLGVQRLRGARLMGRAEVWSLDWGVAMKEGEVEVEV